MNILFILVMVILMYCRILPLMRCRRLICLVRRRVLDVLLLRRRELLGGQIVRIGRWINVGRHGLLHGLHCRFILCSRWVGRRLKLVGSCGLPRIRRLRVLLC